MLTVWNETAAGTSEGAQQQRAGQRPTPTDPIHCEPGQRVARYFHQANEYKVYVFVAAQAGRVQR